MVLKQLAHSFTLRPGEKLLLSAPARGFQERERDGNFYITTHRVIYEGGISKNPPSTKEMPSRPSYQLNPTTTPGTRNGPIPVSQFEGSLLELTAVEHIAIMSAGGETLQFYWVNSPPNAFSLKVAWEQIKRALAQLGLRARTVEMRQGVTSLTPVKVAWETLKPNEMRLTIWNYNNDSGSGGFKSRPYQFSWVAGQLSYIYWGGPLIPVQYTTDQEVATHFATLWLGDWLTDCGVSYT